MSDKKHHNDNVSKFIGKLSSSIDKAVAAMPNAAKEATKKVTEMSAQIQANPTFKDIKHQLSEVGKKAGEKIGLGQPGKEAVHKKATAKKTPEVKTAEPKVKPKPKPQAKKPEK